MCVCVSANLFVRMSYFVVFSVILEVLPDRFVCVYLLTHTYYIYIYVRYSDTRYFFVYGVMNILLILEHVLLYCVFCFDAQTQMYDTPDIVLKIDKICVVFVYVYVHTYVCVYHICKYIYIYLYIYIYIDIYVFIYVHM